MQRTLSEIRWKPSKEAEMTKAFKKSVNLNILDTHPSNITHNISKTSNVTNNKLAFHQVSSALPSNTARNREEVCVSVLLEMMRPGNCCFEKEREGWQQKNKRHLFPDIAESMKGSKFAHGNEALNQQGGWHLWLTDHETLWALGTLLKVHTHTEQEKKKPIPKWRPTIHHWAITHTHRCEYCIGLDLSQLNKA